MARAGKVEALMKGALHTWGTQISLLRVPAPQSRHSLRLEKSPAVIALISRSTSVHFFGTKRTSVVALSN